MSEPDIDVDNFRAKLVTLREKLEQAERIGSGDYGLCRDCDELIAVQRLEFDPTAPEYINCASRADNG